MTAGAESSEGLTGSASRMAYSYSGGQEGPAPRGPSAEGAGSALGGPLRRAAGASSCHGGR